MAGTFALKLDGTVPPPPSLGSESLSIPYFAEARPKTDLGWEIYPEGLYSFLVRLAEYGFPLYILENGIADREAPFGRTTFAPTSRRPSSPSATAWISVGTCTGRSSTTSNGRARSSVYANSSRTRPPGAPRPPGPIRLPHGRASSVLGTKIPAPRMQALFREVDFQAPKRWRAHTFSGHKRSDVRMNDPERSAGMANGREVGHEHVHHEGWNKNLL